MPDHRLNLNLVSRVLSYPPFRARERGLDRVGRREPWEQGWLNLKSIWDRTVQIVTRNENTAGWRGFWWMAQFSFQPFPCMLVNQRENLLLDQDPLWASHHAPLCGWVSTPAPFSHNYDCGSGHLISLSWNSWLQLLVLGFGLEVFLQVLWSSSYPPSTVTFTSKIISAWSGIKRSKFCLLTTVY